MNTNTNGYAIQHQQQQQQTPQTPYMSTGMLTPAISQQQMQLHQHLMLQQQQQQTHHQTTPPQSTSASTSHPGMQNHQSHSQSTTEINNSLDNDDNDDSQSAVNGSTSSGHPQKFSRSKGACQQCRAVKQRCSGAAKHPCERCQLYKLDCVFSKDPPPQSQAPRQPKKSQPKPASSDPETSAAVLQSLRVITERLRAIEEKLAAGPRQVSATPSQASFGGGFDNDVKIPTYESVSGDVGDPVSMVTSAIKGLESAMNAPSPFSTHSPAGSSSPNGTQRDSASHDQDVPDAISRGFVSAEEAQQLFDFYFQRCVNWTPPLDAEYDRNMHVVRRRSTFLFHAILSVASYFCYVPQGENGLRKYYAIVTTLVESLAPLVVSPNPAELTIDLLMGLLICIDWKPVRCGSQMQLGPAGFAQLQAQSKLNPSSGYVLGGLALRISQLLNLSRRAANPSPNDKKSVNACRLWLWICLVDSQNALAEGKNPALDPADALRVTRLFASIRARPCDVRLAAMVELYAAVVPIAAAHYGAERTDFRALYRANMAIDRIAKYWTGPIEQAFVSGDPLACTFLNMFLPFVRVVLNGDVFRTWLIRQKSELNGREMDLENTRFTLTAEEAHCIGFAVSAAEEMLYALSTASKSKGAQRTCNWAPRDMQTGHRPPLKLDADVARRLASSTDQVLLVVYAFPPLFLAQLRAANILNCDLDMAPEITGDLINVGFPARSLLPASKFMRLLELSAEFYEVASPNNDFPAIPQAQLLRSMACLSVPTSGSSIMSYPSGTDISTLQNGMPDSCAYPGMLNTPSSIFGSSASAKAHESQMQQVAASIPPTNPNLPFPYNSMIFSNDGGERLVDIMATAVPDPTSSNSLLGSFAKIDADWNAYFHSAPSLSVYDSMAAATIPSTLNGMGSSGLTPISNMNGSTVPKYGGQSPDSAASLLSTTAPSPGSYYAQSLSGVASHQPPPRRTYS